MIGLQMFTLQHTEPDFDLIQPGGIGRQPEDLKVQSLVTGQFLLTQSALELFRRVGGPVVQDQGHRVDAPSQSFGNNVLLHKGLKIDKAFALAASAVDFSISDGEPGKEMACAPTMVASFVQQRFAWACWARRLFALACLNGRFLIETEQPGACSQECLCLGIGLQHWASSL
jgi:hypothetical protein